MLLNQKDANWPLFILTINQRFLERSLSEGYSHGVVGFVIEVARELKRRGQLCGLIAYQRSLALNEPMLRKSTIAEFTCIEYYFDFTIPTVRLRESFGRAVSLLCGQYAPPDTQRVVIYHQTNVLLPLTPDELPFLVTHHGPFASDVVRVFGDQLALEAFQGGAAKLSHLIDRQQQGIEFLKRNTHGVALEMSSVQENILRVHGVPANRIKTIPPPLRLPEPPVLGSDLFDDFCGYPTINGVAGPDELHLITATARVDAFKNLTQLIRAYVGLAEEGIDVRLTMFVGSSIEEEMRSFFRRSIPVAFRSKASIEQRLPHTDLIRYFSRQRQQSVFVCTSLYETFGITPLEAVLAGMATLVPDLPDLIGVATYLPKAHRFHPDDNSLVDKLRSWHLGKAKYWIGLDQRSAVITNIGVTKCVDKLSRVSQDLLTSSRAAISCRSDNHALTETIVPYK